MPAQLDRPFPHRAALNLGASSEVHSECRTFFEYGLTGHQRPQTKPGNSLKIAPHLGGYDPPIEARTNLEGPTRRLSRFSEARGSRLEVGEGHKPFLEYFYEAACHAATKQKGNVCSYQERSFRCANNGQGDRRLSARSGRRVIPIGAVRSAMSPKKQALIENLRMTSQVRDLQPTFR